MGSLSGMAVWEGTRVFLTGHTGFKGSWLSLWLAELGAEVTGYSLPPLPRSLYEAARLRGEFAETFGDVRDLLAVREAMVRARPDVVIHMAAQPLVRASYADPVGTFGTNVMGTVHVLEAVRTCPTVRAVVAVTTDKVYLNRETRKGYVEEDPLGGNDPYSASKASSELVCASYRASFFSGADAPLLASVRAGNVIGGGDWALDRLVPDIIAAIADGRPAMIRSPRAVRPWQHVLDPLQGYITVAERLLRGERDVGQSWNFGPLPEDVYTVADVAYRIVRRWGGPAKWQSDTGTHPHEAGILVLDPAKAMRRLGWRQRLDIEESIGLTVDWYRDCARGGDAREMTRAQIAQYQKRVTVEPAVSGKES